MMWEAPRIGVGTLDRGKWKGKRADHSTYKKRARRAKVKAARKAAKVKP